MKRYDGNPIITPSMVKPSTSGYRVRGAFNAGACRFEDEILLLLRVAEDCEAEPGEVAVPVVNLSGEGGQGQPGVLRVSLDDPEVQLKDTRGIVYQGKDYLSTLSHIRIARSRDGVEDARVTKIDHTFFINYTCVSPDGWATALASTEDFKEVKDHGIIFHPQNKDV